MAELTSAGVMNPADVYTIKFAAIHFNKTAKKRPVMFFKQIKQIESEPIRKISEYLYDQQIPVTYFGKAWGGCTNNWIYFDTCLDIEALTTLFELDSNIEVHENLDPKSGTERGFIDKNTGEGIMGKIK